MLRRKVLTVFLMGILILVGATAHRAAAQDGSEDERDPVFEAEVLERLGAINPEAVPVFEQATRDFDAENYAAAKAGFEQVLEMSPGFPDAFRRLASTEIALEMLSIAKTHAEQAYRIDPSGPNAGVLAYALLLTDTASTGERELALAQQAYGDFPDKPFYNYVLFYAAVQAEDLEQARQAAEAMTRTAPADPLGYYFLGLLEADSENWMSAEENLIKARELGFPSDEIDAILEDQEFVDGVRNSRFRRMMPYFLVGWFLGLLLLLRLREALARRTRPDLIANAGKKAALIRWAHSSVAMFTALYFFFFAAVIILFILTVYLP